MILIKFDLMRNNELGSYFLSDFITNYFNKVCMIALVEYSIDPWIKLYESSLEEEKKFYIKREQSSESRELIKNGEINENIINELRFLMQANLSKEFILFNIKKLILLDIFSSIELYLYQSFRYILKKYPNILRKKVIELGKLLELSSKEDQRIIIDRIIEKELHNLFYKDYKKIFDFAQKKLSLNFNVEKNLIIKMDEYKLIRNLFVHGNGTINRLYLSKTQNCDLKYGEKIEITLDLLDEIFNVAIVVLNKFDAIMVKKFPELLQKPGLSISPDGDLVFTTPPID